VIEDLKPYSETRDSGLPWLGDIPAHWEIKRNGSLFQQRNAVGEPDWPILEVSLRTGVRIREFGSTKRKQVMSDKAKYKCATKGDFVYNMMRMWQGAAGIAPVDGLVSPAYVVAKPLPHTNPAYFASLFRTDDYLAEIDSFSRGIVKDRNRLYWDQFKQIPTPCPPPEEQAAIARFLAWATNRLDRAIGAKRRIIALLQEQKQAIIHRAVTRGLDPSVPLKDSGIPWLGEIPEHWEVTRVKSEFGCLNFRRIPLSTTERGKMKLRQYDYYGASGIIDKVDEYIFDDNLILIAEDGANLVNRNLPLAIIARGKYWVNNHAHILMPRKGSLEYLAALLECMDYRPWISGAAQPKLTQDRLMSIRIALPPPEEQSRIVEVFNKEAAPIELSIRELLQEVNLLREYRTRLIADVVTGKLDVREMAKELPEEELQDQPDIKAVYDADDSEEDAESDLIDPAEP
jgi:type I restriction enzyme S subunit